jgi:NAD(P)-dependent dehydrogenase (short-subunit alcohol dehydrogenase family)
MKLSGHAALVTGGASGLGAATARALAGAGAKVAVLDVNAEAAAAVAKEIGGLALTCDVADAKSAEAAVAKARAAHGAARVLVNCAGIGPAQRIVGREGPMPLEAFKRVIDINLIGSFNLMRLAAADMTALPALEDGERGVIISTASVAAYEGQIGQAAYSASKGGIVALTLPAAREFARSGIRVNAIAPGLFATPLLLGMPQNVQDSLAQSVPFPTRFGKPEEYAALVLHILANPMINGETIRLDGAIRMQPK